MIFAKRVAVLVSAAIILVLIYQLRSRDYHSTLQGLSQKVGLGELVDDEELYGQQNVNTPNPTHELLDHASTQNASIGASASSLYAPGIPKQSGSNYTRGLVIGHLTSENTTWLDEYLPTDPSIVPYIYIVDDHSAPLHTPQNKGHEAMVYLTYILDHYDALPEISIFMHPHRIAWHTPELLNHDATELLKRLSNERVIREGYMNLRCHWDPGCPERLRPGTSLLDNSKHEERATAAAWAEMFPDDPIPDALGAPCCAQFAVSRERIRSIPKAKFERYRDWLLRTKETDWISGRVFEYLWQQIFAGQAKLCPDARVCYCDGYGICFETPELYEEWFDNHHYWHLAVKELEQWDEKAKILDGVGNWQMIETMDLDIPAPGWNVELKREIEDRLAVLVRMRTAALKAGTDPEVRARVAGRQWQSGNGY